MSIKRKGVTRGDIVKALKEHDIAMQGMYKHILLIDDVLAKYIAMNKDEDKLSEFMTSTGRFLKRLELFPRLLEFTFVEVESLIKETFWPLDNILANVVEKAVFPAPSTSEVTYSIVTKTPYFIKPQKIVDYDRYVSDQEEYLLLQL